ncbi:unnamed protein product [Coregonus sp. 'balchen']|nr:unnamed protein product [Coregonus sp. 'balchen']
MNCEDFIEERERHSSPLFVPDIPALLGVPDRARLTQPPGLEVRTSGIAGAGLGVYANCPRCEEEQNLVAFQYRGGILYRSCKPIAVCLVWRGVSMGHKEFC